MVLRLHRVHYFYHVLLSIVTHSSEMAGIEKTTSLNRLSTSDQLSSDTVTRAVI